MQSSTKQQKIWHAIKVCYYLIGSLDTHLFGIESEKVKILKCSSLEKKKKNRTLCLILIMQKYPTSIFQLAIKTITQTYEYEYV